jgi:hypothetical protein
MNHPQASPPMIAPRTRWTGLNGYHQCTVDDTLCTVCQAHPFDGTRWVLFVQAKSAPMLIRIASSERAAKRRAVAEARKLGGVR